MSRLGRAALLIAAALMVFVAATWSRGEPATSAMHADGASLFVAKGCATCHVGPDTKPPIGGFPPLDDVRSFAAGRRPPMSAEEYLTESMAAPEAFISPAFSAGSGPYGSMPQLRLSSDEIETLVSYLLGGRG